MVYLLNMFFSIVMLVYQRVYIFHESKLRLAKVDNGRHILHRERTQDGSKKTCSNLGISQSQLFQPKWATTWVHLRILQCPHYIYISINLGYWIDTMWCPLVVAYWFLSPTVDMCAINRCYSMFWSLRYSSVGLWLGHLEIAVGVYIDGRIDLQIKRTTGINWLDRLSRNVVFLCSWRSFGEST